ncbi:MAG: radical SAM protein [Phycisphaerae bacterium]
MADSPGRSSLIRDHRRQWRRCLYVYPVIARRSKGLSVGVNLNPRRDCTFACAYCQVDRRIPRGLHEVSLPLLRDELEEALEAAVSGELWKEERFSPTPEAMRRISDIAFSGDGEPTCLPDFDKAVQVAADVKRELGLGEVKIVVITNSTNLQSPQVTRALPILDANNGEIWAKLDAGTEEYFQRINRPRGPITLERIVQNITAVATGRPVVIQTLLARIEGQPPDDAEIRAYCGRIGRILAGGGRIKLIQVHTVARPPAERYVTPLSNGELDAIAERIRQAVPGAAVETYYGAGG